MLGHTCLGLGLVEEVMPAICESLKCALKTLKKYIYFFSVQ